MGGKTLMLSPPQTGERETLDDTNHMLFTQAQERRLFGFPSIHTPYPCFGRASESFLFGDPNVSCFSHLSLSVKAGRRVSGSVKMSSVKRALSVIVAERLCT